MRTIPGEEMRNVGGEEITTAPTQPLPVAVPSARGPMDLLRDYAHAIPDFDEAIRLNPKYPNAYQNRGLARKASGDAGGGAADSDKARDLLK